MRRACSSKSSLLGIGLLQSTRSVRSFASAPLLKDFNWQDPLNAESLLTEEEKMVRDMAHDYSQKQLLPRVLKANREENFHR